MTAPQACTARPTAANTAKRSLPDPETASSPETDVATQSDERPAKASKPSPQPVYATIVDFDLAVADELAKIHPNAIDMMRGKDVRDRAYRSRRYSAFGGKAYDWRASSIRFHLALHKVMPRDLATAHPELCNVEDNFTARYQKIRAAITKQNCAQSGAPKTK